MNPSNTPESVKVRKNSTLYNLNSWMTFIGVEYYSFINAVENKGKVSIKDVDYFRLKDATAYADHVIALGGFASKALSKAKIGHYRLPHPSPLNRQLNDKINLGLILMELKSQLGGYDGS